jgi:alpha-beta hydrolase superfamily lysophospholipase
MKQITIRMFVALTMCGVTSLLRLTRFVVISPTLQVHNEAIWILRIILASVLSPLLYGFLDRRTSTWAIRSKHQRQAEEFPESHKRPKPLTCSIRI